MSSLPNLEKFTVHTSFICSLVLGKRIAFEEFMFPSATSISKGDICDWCGDGGVLRPGWLNVAHLQPETLGFMWGQRQESRLVFPETLPGWESLCLLTARRTVPSSGTFLLLLLQPAREMRQGSQQIGILKNLLCLWVWLGVLVGRRWESEAWGMSLVLKNQLFPG